MTTPSSSTTTIIPTPTTACSPSSRRLTDALQSYWPRLTRRAACVRIAHVSKEDGGASVTSNVPLPPAWPNASSCTPVDLTIRIDTHDKTLECIVQRAQHVCVVLFTKLLCQMKRHPNVRFIMDTPVVHDRQAHCVDLRFEFAMLYMSNGSRSPSPSS